MADFYKILECARDASEDEIKKAYRKLAMQYHPDRNGGSKEAEERFKQITEAYDVLRDGNKRATYDRYGEEGLRRGGGAGMHHVDLSEALGIFMRDFGGFSGFEEMFGGSARGNQRSGADVKITMPLTLPEVMIGVEKKIVVKLLDPCERCEGSGAEPGTKPQRCNTCAGSGEVRRAQRSFFGQFVSVAPCPTCAGQGKTIEIPCKRCKGEGRSRAEHTIAVPIPAGVSTGQYLMLRGQGSVGPLGGPRGDILVAFEVEDDPRFERDGADLYTEVLVTYGQLVMGADVSVPYISTTLSLRVPNGTQSGQVFQLRGRGLPRVNASGSGDLQVRVQLWTPQTLSSEQETIIKALREAEAAPPATRARGFWSRMKDALGA